MNWERLPRCVMGSLPVWTVPTDGDGFALWVDTPTCEVTTGYILKRLVMVDQQHTIRTKHPKPRGLTHTTQTGCLTERCMLGNLRRHQMSQQ